ncbi:MAG TPA: sugar phosphate isomerase/epimerase [Clostridiales bacterium]|nr:sugar phosphate isomerase/epimerase [Clostridiales bacterium]
MDNLKVAAQLYTIRDYTKTVKDIKSSLKKVADIGYSAVQVSGMGPIEPETLKSIVDDLGLTICATHIPFERMEEDIDSVIREHKLWACKYVGIGSMPSEYRGTLEGVKKFAKKASTIGKLLSENGLRLIYHNHAFEFSKLGGRTIMDILFEETDEDFDFELDTYWIQVGGGNPVDWIYRVEGRMDVVHFKDMVGNLDNSHKMTEVGEGNLNWSAIIKACQDTGVKWCAVERDICERSPFDSLEISLNNLKRFGLE